MDAHIRWVRRVIARSLLLRLAVEAAFLAVPAAGLMFGLGVEPIVIVPAALAIIQLGLCIRVLLGLHANPVDVRFLRRYADRSERLVADEWTELDGDLTDALTARRLAPYASLRSFEDHELRTVIHRDRTGSVLALVEPGDGTPTIVTALDDERILVTSGFFVPPANGVVVNHVRTNSIRRLVHEHVDRLRMLASQGVEPASATVEHVVSLLRAEHRGWEGIGQWLGPFVAVGRRRLPHLLQVRIPEAELWTRSSSLIDRVELVDDVAVSRMLTTAPAEAAEVPDVEAQERGHGPDADTAVRPPLQPPPIPVDSMPAAA